MRPDPRGGVTVATAKRIATLANPFGMLLHQYFGDLKMAAIVAVNAADAADGHPKICASHDWCDANVFMNDAMLAVVPNYSGFDIRDQEIAVLCNGAWTLAKKRGFKHIEIPQE